MAAQKLSRAFMLMGQCVPSMKQNAAKIRVRRMELDKNLLMVSLWWFYSSGHRTWTESPFQYFKEDEFYYAHDPHKTCKTGDIVVIKELPQKLTTLITHSIAKVVYPLGDVTDPITGRSVVGMKYRDDIEDERRLFGKTKNSFDYEKAPARGRLEGTRDFTDKETYYKVHEDGKDHPYAY